MMMMKMMMKMMMMMMTVNTKLLRKRSFSKTLFKPGNLKTPVCGDVTIIL